jgi:hypothetical protein
MTGVTTVSQVPNEVIACCLVKPLQFSYCNL